MITRKISQSTNIPPALEGSLLSREEQIHFLFPLSEIQSVVMNEWCLIYLANCLVYPLRWPRVTS